jgi:hypothetical protein
MDFNQAFDQQVEHLAKMALQKGWIAYAKERAQELENDPTGLWVGLIKAVRERLEEMK